MRRIGQAGVVLLLLATAIVVPTTAAQACSCAMGTPTERLDRADAVFLGEVIERKGKRVKENPFAGTPFTYTFAVERVYKGEVDVDQRVVAGANGAACGIVLNPGKTYLVYGTAGNTLGVKDVAPDEYSTHLCSGTGRAATAPAVYGDGEPPIGAPAEPPLSAPADPDFDSASAVPTGAVVAGAAILGLALVVGLLYLRRRKDA